MNFLKTLFGKGQNDPEIKALSDGFCPNCWGVQEYDNLVREKYADTQIDVNNHSAKYAFIQNFMVTHMDGIKLKNTIKGKECPSCKVVYNN